MQFLFFILLATFCFEGCSDLVSGYVFDKEDSPSRYMYVTMEQSYYIVSNSSRTITAPAIDYSSNVSNYYFYIWGKSASGTVAPHAVKFSATSNSVGTIEIDFPVTSYLFVLAVTSTEFSESDLSASSADSLILSKALAVGYTNADLSYSKTVNFSLSEKSLSGFGSVYLNFLLDSSWKDEEVSDLLADYTVKVGIYDDADKMWDGYAEIMLYPLSKSVPVYSGNWFRSVPSGEYDLKISIIRNSDNLVFSYSDKIIISPNRSINFDVNIPNIVDSVPASPSDFKAAWSMDYKIYSIYSSDTHSAKTLTEEDDVDDYNFDGYGLLLKWTDNSNNETGFKITLVDVSKIYSDTVSAAENVANIPAVITDSYWNSLVGSYEGNTDIVKIYDANNYYAFTEYIDGSLEKNQEGIILYVPFGACYIAKIEAENDVGLSKACYASLGEVFDLGVYNEHYGNNTKLYKGRGSFAGNVINAYKILYYLHGGSLYYTENNKVQKITGYKIGYSTYGDGQILCPIAETASTGTETIPALFYEASDFTDDYKLWYETKTGAKSGDRWKKWTKGSVFGNDYDNVIETIDGFSYQKPITYTGYTSLYLFARYD
ncbi:MAG: hypothetical protein IJ630_09160 [Treponema sp.]|nr:hypothetical protein [Treponema sp.]